ncbi:MULTISPECIES: protease HtpX [unclassified Acinetobacter]|uniref:protease HtpX n=1 Tax=unclassified Acinetobacter TaxID=196816 RepID=UPI0035B9FBEB
MMRIVLFLMTNLAVMVVAGIVLSILGVGASNGQDLLGTLIFCFAIGMTGSLISLFMSKWIAKKSSGTRVIETPTNATEQWLMQTTARLAEKAGIKTPEVGIFPAAEPNAFATGWNKNAALMAVSVGLLNNLTEDEVEAVIAHEIGHIANGDMVTLALIQGVVNTFVMFFARIIGSVIDNMLFKRDGQSGGVSPTYFMIRMVLEMVFGFLASLIVMWFSRYREYRADEAGARLAGRQSMINALLRLQSGSAGTQAMLPKEMQAFAINGFNVKSLFSTHPSIEQRVKALQELNLNQA